MRDNNYQHSYHGLPDHDFASRSLSVTEQAGQHCSDNSSASVQYQSAMSMAPSQPSNLAAKTSQHSLDHMGSMHYQTPMTMWHQIPSQSSNLAAMSMMPQNQQQDAAAVSMMLQSQGLRYYPAPMKMFSSPLQQTQNSQFYHASVACSKRFSEEEKQKLEKVFTDETQKPSTSRKRQLAEELGCPVPKVNVGQPFGLHYFVLLTCYLLRTGSRIEGPEKSKCIESKRTRQAKLQTGQLPRMTASRSRTRMMMMTKMPSAAKLTA